jgi:hypothetical protein
MISQRATKKNNSGACNEYHERERRIVHVSV